MNCRGHQKRIEIVRKYDVHAIAHTRLLNGQTKWSCAQRELEREYYCFSYSEKNGGNDNGIFYCGLPTAIDFLTLANLEPLTLFNPLVAEPQQGGHVGDANNTQQVQNQRPWNPISKQLINAINMLLVCWNTSPRYALAEIHQKVSKYFYNEPFIGEIKGVNTCISAGGTNTKTLQEMIDELREENNVRIFDFGLLNEKLTELGIKSNFG